MNATIKKCLNAFCVCILSIYTKNTCNITLKCFNMLWVLKCFYLTKNWGLCVRILDKYLAHLRILWPLDRPILGKALDLPLVPTVSVCGALLGFLKEYKEPSIAVRVMAVLMVLYDIQQTVVLFSKYIVGLYGHKEAYVP